MTVTGVGSTTLPILQSLSSMKSKLDDLQKQLASGLKSDTYAGFGTDRGLTVGLRSQLSAITGFQQTNTLVGVRLEMMQTALTEFDSVAQQAKSTIAQSQFALNGGTTTTDQANAVNVLDQLLGTLNTAVDGRFLFSGSDVTQPAVDTADHILNGDGAKAGLKQLIDERKQADLGADGLGRLSVGGTGSAVSLTEDAAPPFGFKLAGATTSIAGATVSGPTGSPASLTVDLGATNPNEGDTVKFSFNLPDGTTADLTLTATAASPPGPGQFTIGATPGDTANNLKTALTAGLQTLAGTQLAAASAVAAGNDFFNTDADHPPQRVGGSPPFYAATGLVDGTPDNTVQWYKGDAAANDPRTSVTAQIDQSVTVSYGARANEEALRTAVQSVAVFAATSFSGGATATNQTEYSALKQRLGATLGGNPNQQKISDIGTQLATAQTALQNTKDRQDQTNTTLANLLQNVQGAPTEQVAMQLLTLQTSLQATMQTTAMLLKTSLVNYL
jgi:flagellin-like hook-associated protein FlgL